MAIIIDGSTGITRNGDSYSLNVEVMNTTGDESFAGDKTFSDNIILQGESVSPFTGFKNQFINGGFGIAQRYTFPIAKAITANETYVFDRFAHSIAPGAALTVYSGRDSVNLPYDSVVTGVVGAATVTYNLILQKVENPYRFSGKTMTFSFNCRISTGTTKGLRMVVYNSATTSVVGVKDIVATATDAQYSYTFDVPDMSGDSITASDFLQVYVQDALDHKTFTAVFKNWQLEEGSVATAFEQRPIGLELNLCKRYYVVIANGKYSNYGATANTTASPIGYSVHDFRTTPSITVITAPSTEINGALSVGVLADGLYFYMATIATGRVYAAGGAWALDAEL